MKTVEQKRVEAVERNQKWSRLSAREKLESLDARLGKGQGAAKQRLALEEILRSEVPAPPLPEKKSKKKKSKKQ